MFKEKKLGVFYNEADRERLLEGLDQSERDRIDQVVEDAVDAGFAVMPETLARRLIEGIDAKRFERETVQGKDGEGYAIGSCNGGDDLCALSKPPKFKVPPADDPMAREGLAKALERVQQVWQEEIDPLVERERERLQDPTIDVMLEIRDDGLYLGFGKPP